MAPIQLPEEIRSLLQGRPLREETIGRSGAQIRIAEDMVLKIQPQSESAERELTMLRWLDGRLPVPKLLAEALVPGTQYILMSRIPGHMACDTHWLDRPGPLFERLEEAFHRLWAVDITDCPLLCSPEIELVQARERVVRGLVEVDAVEPETFGPGGFRDPEALLGWLEDHVPAFEPVFSHGDFCLPNLFLTEDGIGGFLDLASAGIGDRWRDLALCHRSLRHNTDGHYGPVKPGLKPDRLFERLGLRPDEEKLRWYRLLDELF